MEDGDHGRWRLAGLLLKPVCLLSLFSSPQGLLSLFSYTNHDHLTMGDTAHSGLSPPTTIINSQNAPTGQGKGGSSPVEVIPSKLYLDLCQVDKNLTNTVSKGII